MAAIKQTSVCCSISLNLYMVSGIMKKEGKRKATLLLADMLMSTA